MGWSTVAEFKVEKIEEYWSIRDFRSKADELPAGTPVRISMDFSPVPVSGVFDVVGAEHPWKLAFVGTGFELCDVYSPGGTLSTIGVVEGYMQGENINHQAMCESLLEFRDIRDIQPAYSWAIAGVVAAVVSVLAALGITLLILCKIEAILPPVLLYGTIMLGIAGATLLGALFFRYKTGVRYG